MGMVIHDIKNKSFCAKGTEKVLLREFLPSENSIFEFALE